MGGQRWLLSHSLRYSGGGRSLGASKDPLKEMVCELGFEVRIGVYQKDNNCEEEKGEMKRESSLGEGAAQVKLCGLRKHGMLENIPRSGLAEPPTCHSEALRLHGFQGVDSARYVKDASKLRAEVRHGCGSRMRRLGGGRGSAQTSNAAQT